MPSLTDGPCERLQANKMNRNHQMRRLDTKGQEALKRALSNPVKTEKPDKSTR